MIDPGLFLISMQVAKVSAEALKLDLYEVEEWMTNAERLLRIHDTETSILEPTRWREERRALAHGVKLARSFYAFRKIVEEVSH